MTYKVSHSALVNKVQTQAICNCRITARSVIWSTSYFPKVSIFLLTALGGFPENPGYCCTVNVVKAHSIKFIDSQLHLLDQKVLDFDARFCTGFFSCLASILFSISGKSIWASSGILEVKSGLHLSFHLYLEVHY